MSLTVKKLVDTLNLKVLTNEDKLNKKVTDCYIGDLLSWVMSKATEDCAWLTVMGNINSIAVATLTDVACIILTENASLDDNAKEKAISQEVIILQSDKSSYNLAVEIYNLLKES